MAKIRVLFQYADLNNPSFPNLQNFVKSLDKDAVIFRNLSTSTFISKMQSIWKDSSGKLHPAFIGVNSGLGTRIVIGQEVLPGEFRVAMVQDFEPNYDTNYISQWYWHVINRIFPLKYFCESDFTIGSVKANSPAYDSAFDTEAEAKENCKPIILAKVRYLVDSDGAIISVSENDPDYLKAYATKEEALKNKPSSKTTMYLIGGAAVLAILLFLRKKIVSMEIKYFHKVNCPYCESITNEISLIRSAIEAKKDIWTDYLFSANGVATDEIMKQEKESYNITSVPNMIVINNSGGQIKYIGPEAIRRVTPDLIKQIQESADVTITADKPTNSMAFIGVTLALLLLALLKSKK